MDSRPSSLPPSPGSSLPSSHGPSTLAPAEGTGTQSGLPVTIEDSSPQIPEKSLSDNAIQTPLSERKISISVTRTLLYGFLSFFGLSNTFLTRKFSCQWKLDRAEQLWQRGDKHAAVDMIAEARKLYPEGLPEHFQEQYREMLQLAAVPKYLGVYNISAAKKPPESVVLIGLNGCGKTSLINALHKVGTGSQDNLVPVERPLDPMQATTEEEEEKTVQWFGQTMSINTLIPGGEGAEKTLDALDVDHMQNADEVLYLIQGNNTRFEQKDNHMVDLICQSLIKAGRVTGSNKHPDWSNVRVVLTMMNAASSQYSANCDTESKQAKWLESRIDNYLGSINRRIRSQYPGIAPLTREHITIAGHHEETDLAPDPKAELWATQIYQRPETPKA